MSLDSLFSQIEREGWRVNNLYQSLETGLWRVCLYAYVEGGTNHGDWAEADTLELALEDAIHKMATAEFVEDTSVTFSREQAPNRSSLLTALGLGKSKPINLSDRRF